MEAQTQGQIQGAWKRQRGQGLVNGWMVPLEPCQPLTQQRGSPKRQKTPSYPAGKPMLKEVESWLRV